MTRSFRHKGLQAFYETGSKAGILPQHAARLRGLWAVTVQANWRLTFRFEGPDVELLDYLDYH